MCEVFKVVCFFFSFEVTPNGISMPVNDLLNNNNVIIL